ncbi:MAG: glycosyltransferase family 2 protein [Alphaproteobacteria bacterium]|jgi:glycosyltransferase involved in cell wall biosynthesis|nr:glycosyltransferase family 2 protein [Alphaproteobacteria bacterium]
MRPPRQAGTESARQLLSVIVPAYDEAEVLPAFHDRLTATLDAIDVDCEVIYVNDGSTDETLAVVEHLRDSDPRIGIVNLSRNFGKEVALTAGLDHASGDAAIAIDADLQDPPELIPELIGQWRQGYDVVYAKRLSRAGESFVKKATARAFYRVIQRIGGNVRIPADTGDYRLISRRALEALSGLRERHRFMKGLFAWIGFRQKAVTYHRAPRHAGTSKWSYWQLWNFSLEGITGFTIGPLKVATYIGMATALLAIAYGIYLIIETLLFGNPVAGYPSLMVAILMLGGLQLMTIGIVGEYLGRIFNETKGRPLYLVADYLPARTAAADTTVETTELRAREGRR